MGIALLSQPISDSATPGLSWRISPPPLLQVTGALLSLLFQSSFRKTTPGQGELSSDMPGKEMQLRVAELKLHNVAGLSIYLVWVEGWKGNLSLHVTTTNKTHRI